MKKNYIQPSLKCLDVETEQIAGLPASGPDAPTVGGAKEMGLFETETEENALPAVKVHSVWDD